ncbi:MAG TPA: response regulator [Candidatus Angelobacter sp.]|nr:response regulator [Candidatus Angelobacter sp.]
MQAQGRQLEVMSRKVLYVDDYSTTLLMKQLLFAKPTNYNLVTARDGWEAIQKAVSEQPDLILMDGIQPNMDACREMSKIQKLQRVPIFLITNGNKLSNIENRFAIGARDTAQPLNWRKLLEMVDIYLTSHSVNR